MVASVSAQTIVKGDMNGDGELTITDAVKVVNVILGNAPKQAIDLDDTYRVDNALVVGTWYAPGVMWFDFNEDGTTTYPGGVTYEFMPVQGRLLIYDAEENPVKVLPLVKVKKEYLLAADYTTGTFTKYIAQHHGEYVDLGLPSGTLWATCNITLKTSRVIAPGSSSRGGHFLRLETMRASMRLLDTTEPVGEAVDDALGRGAIP